MDTVMSFQGAFVQTALATNIAGKRLVTIHACVNVNPAREDKDTTFWTKVL